jgi:hypothetical protein
VKGAGTASTSWLLSAAAMAASSSAADGSGPYGREPWTVETLRRAVERYAWCRTVVSNEQLNECYAIGEALDEYNKGRFRELRDENPENPAMYMYMSDGWGSFVSSHTTAQAEDRLVVSSAGKFLRTSIKLSSHLK